METKDAMKAVINASTARTETTLADTDLIQLYDNNGNPIYKISKRDFMSAVYNYLTSSSVASNLASVLGETNYFIGTVTIPYGETVNINNGKPYRPTLFVDSETTGMTFIVCPDYQDISYIASNKVLSNLEITSGTNGTINIKNIRANKNDVVLKYRHI